MWLGSIQPWIFSPQALSPGEQLSVISKKENEMVLHDCIPSHGSQQLLSLVHFLLIFIVCLALPFGFTFSYFCLLSFSC